MECAGIIAERKQSKKAEEDASIHQEEKVGKKITLLTEIRAESRGILWFGEEESETAGIHSEKTAVVLRGEEMRRWREERQRRRYLERSTTVKIGNMKIMAVYQPLWSNGREGVERYREEIEEELAGSSREEVLILGGDHNAQIGRGKEMEGS